MIPPPAGVTSLEGRRNIFKILKCTKNAYEVKIEAQQRAATIGLCDDNIFHGQIWKHPLTIIIVVIFFTKPVQHCTEQYVQTAQQPVCTLNLTIVPM